MELEALRKDMVAAMKAKDKVTKEAVSALIAAVKKAAIDEGCRDDIKGELVDKVILKELKTAKEQIDTCPAERTDLKEERFVLIVPMHYSYYFSGFLNVLPIYWSKFPVPYEYLTKSLVPAASKNYPYILFYFYLILQPTYFSS